VKTAETEELWRAYRAAHPDVGDDYDVVAFGDSAAQADELAELVVAGTKRATAGSAYSFEGDDAEPAPVLGGHVVLVDGAGRPRCVWRTTQLDVKPLTEVDAAFAWDEGEGDRSLAYWLDAHRAYFTREAGRLGYPFDDAMPTVLERFTVVWPPELAD